MEDNIIGKWHFKENVFSCFRTSLKKTKKINSKYIITVFKNSCEIEYPSLYNPNFSDFLLELIEDEIAKFIFYNPEELYYGKISTNARLIEDNYPKSFSYQLETGSQPFQKKILVTFNLNDEHLEENNDNDELKEKILFNNADDSWLYEKDTDFKTTYYPAAFFRCPICGKTEPNWKFYKTKNKNIDLLFENLAKEQDYFKIFLEYFYDAFNFEKIFDISDRNKYDIICPHCNYSSDEYCYLKEEDKFLNDIVIYKDNEKISLVYYYRRYYNRGPHFFYDCFKEKIVINTHSGQSYLIGPWKKNNFNTYLKHTGFVIKNITFGGNAVIRKTIYKNFQNDLVRRKSGTECNDIKKGAKKLEVPYIISNEVIDTLFNAIVSEKLQNYEFCKNIQIDKMEIIWEKYKNFIDFHFISLDNIFLFNKMPVLWVNNHEFVIKNFNIFESNLGDIYSLYHIEDYDLYDEYFGVKVEHYNFNKKFFLKKLKGSCFYTMDELTMSIIKNKKMPKKLKKMIIEDLKIFIDYQCFQKIGFSDINFFYNLVKNRFNFYYFKKYQDFVKDIIRLKGPSNACKFLEESCNSDFLKDTLDFYNKINNIKDLQQTELMIQDRDLIGNLKEIHDRLSIKINEIKNINVKINYTVSEMCFNDKIDEYDFILAKDTLSLTECGANMKICVGGYREKAIEKKSIIVFIKKEDTFFACLEIVSNNLVQAKNHCNKQINEDVEALLLIWAEKNNINYSECRDLKHILIDI